MDQAPDTESVAAAASPACELKNKDIESSAVGVSKSKADEPLFQLKKWNGVAMWSWDVTTESCAICRINLLEPCSKCQSEDSKNQHCVVVWGECNHSFHHCCMSLWIMKNNRCPLCQATWNVQRIGK